MQGKYSSYGKYALARLQRGILRTIIRPLARWRPLKGHKPGFTIVVACHAHFARMLIGNLRMLIKQDLSALDRVIICFDGPKSDALNGFERDAQAEFPQLRIECLHQSKFQSKILRKIGWGWVDCWLSYAKGIAAARTNCVMLHDMDAFLLDPDFVANRLAEFQRRGDQFVGIRWYEGNGVVPDDQLCYIVEMMLDAGFVREHFHPLDLFNHICMYKGRNVDFDTLLYPQSKQGKRSIQPVSETEWVHPSQVISQFTYLKSRPVYTAPATNNLFFIPYFLYLADDATIMDEHRRALDKEGVVDFLGGKLDLSRFAEPHFNWVEKQVVRLETAIAGGVRPEVQAYLDAIGRRCSSSKSPSTSTPEPALCPTT